MLSLFYLREIPRSPRRRTFISTCPFRLDSPSSLIYQGKGRLGYPSQDSVGSVLRVLAYILVDREEDQTASALITAIPVKWDETYDVVIPHGDPRASVFENVWIFDIPRDTLILVRRDPLSSAYHHCTVNLALARTRLLTQNDFSLPTPVPAPASPISPDVPSPHWEPVICHHHRERRFLGRLLQDFGHTWRHLCRRQQRYMTYLHLAYATIWMSSLNFTIRERAEVNYEPEWPYVDVLDLPKWSCPDAKAVHAGGLRFVLTQNLAEGLQAIRSGEVDDVLTAQGETDHITTVLSESKLAAEKEEPIYAILTLQHIVLVRRQNEGLLEWTKPEVLFDGENPPSDRAIDFLLLASKTRKTHTTRLHLLPVELQDHVLHFTASSSLAAARLGCELELGSAFHWHDGKDIIEVEDGQTKGVGISPVESLVMFRVPGLCFSGLAYRPQPHNMPVQALPAPPAQNQPPAPPPPAPLWSSLFTG